MEGQLSFIPGYVYKEPEIKRKTNKLKTMNELYGSIDRHTCGECEYLLRFDYHGRIYFKCSLWRLSHSTATDKRLKDIACRKFQTKI